MALSYIISEIKQSIGRKWRFFHIRCIRRNHRGSRLNIPITFGTEKLEWCGYPLLKKKFDMFTVSTEYRRATYRPTDRRTERQTSCDSIVRAVHSIVP